MSRIPLLLFILALATAPAASGDSLADGIKAVSSYDYGTNRADIVAFDTFIRSQPGDRARVEAALLPLLAQEDVSTGAKDYLCRWLGLIGSDASIPALKKLTADPKLSHLAVYALFDLDTPAARAALLDSLGAVPAALRPAIIGALGRARVTDAVPALARAASSDDTTEVAAALDALGTMATPAALEALRSARVAAPLETTRQWALLHAANGVLEGGTTGQDTAKSVFASLLKPGTPPALRNAAAKGCIQADPATALDVVLPLLKDDDARVRSGAIRLTPLLSSADLKTLASSLSDLDPATQAAVVNNLVETPSTAVEPILQAALASAHPEVRLSAIAGFGAANLPGSVSVLVPLLARGSNEAAAAAGSLKKLPQSDTGTRLKAALVDAPSPVKAALLTVLADRQDRSAFDLFLASTDDTDPAIATAGFRGVETVAGGNDLDRVASLLPRAKTNAERKSLNIALFRCARTAPDKDKAVDFLIDALHGASPDTGAACSRPSRRSPRPGPWPACEASSTRHRSIRAKRSFARWPQCILPMRINCCWMPPRTARKTRKKSSPCGVISTVSGRKVSVSRKGSRRTSRRGPLPSVRRRNKPFSMR